MYIGGGCKSSLVAEHAAVVAGTLRMVDYMTLSRCDGEFWLIGNDPEVPFKARPSWVRSQPTRRTLGIAGWDTRVCTVNRWRVAFTASFTMTLGDPRNARVFSKAAVVNHNGF